MFYLLKTLALLVRINLMEGNTPPLIVKCLNFFIFWNPSKMVLLEIRNILFFGKLSNYKYGTPQPPHLEDGAPSLCLGRKLKQQEGNEKINELKMKKMENEKMKNE